MALTPIQRLERYTIQHPQEVILLLIEQAGELQEILVFRGFSSSLTQATNYDPDVPIAPEDAQILRCDRLQSPYNPDHPIYLETDLRWSEMEVLLNAAGI